MSRVLVEVDPAFSRAQFEVLREHFADYRLGIPGVREHPKGTFGRWDVDSGPLILGYSGPGVVVGAAAARVHGDERLADILLGGTEFVGVPVEWFGRRRYAGGVVPVGDAFIAWTRSSALGGEGPWEPVLPRLWALPLHLFSVVFAAFLVWRGGLIGWTRRALGRDAGTTSGLVPSQHGGGGDGESPSGRDDAGQEAHEQEE